MRIFEKYEMKKQKCHICGCRNKVHTELLNRQGRFVGYKLKCCNCGRVDTFYLDYPSNGCPCVQREHDYIEGKDRCIQSTYCPRTDCKLYGKNALDDDSNEFKPDHNSNKCPCEEFEPTATVEVLNKPKYL